MRQRDWPIPPKRKSEFKKAWTGKFSPEFEEALREYSAEETQRLRQDGDGHQRRQRVSQSIIVETLSLEADARLRRLYQQHIRKAER